MDFETLMVQPEGALMVVRFNRPERRNAINRQMHLEIQAVCRTLADDFETRVVIFRGEGGFFSSGADTSEWGESASSNELEVRHTSGIGSRTSAAIEGLDQITIAAVEGFAVGGAVVLTACCDLRVAGESAWFSIPEVDVEMPLTWGALPRLMRELGPARTKELVMTCDRFTSAQALQWGFVNHVYPDDQVVGQARKLADKLLGKDPLSLAMTKSTTTALARMMVPDQATHAEREQMLLAYMMRRQRAAPEKE